MSSHASLPGMPVHHSRQSLLVLRRVRRFGQLLVKIVENEGLDLRL